MDGDEIEPGVIAGGQRIASEVGDVGVEEHVVGADCRLGREADAPDVAREVLDAASGPYLPGLRISNPTAAGCERVCIKHFSEPNINVILGSRDVARRRVLYGARRNGVK